MCTVSTESLVSLPVCRHPAGDKHDAARSAVTRRRDSSPRNPAECGDSSVLLPYRVHILPPRLSKHASSTHIEARYLRPSSGSSAASRVPPCLLRVVEPRGRTRLPPPPPHPARSRGHCTWGEWGVGVPQTVAAAAALFEPLH